jgi:hypothetical protein
MMGLRAGSRRWRVRLAFTGAIALAAALVAVAGAQSGGSSSDRPVLHEQVEGLTDFRWDPIDAAGATGPGTIPGTPGTPLVPGASGAEPPPTSAEMPTDVPMPPRPDAHVSDVPSPAFHPDLDTNSATLPRDPNPAGILWSPSPGPYLRQQVYDVVRADGTLDSPQARPEELRPAEPPIGAADTERFIGRARLVVSDDMPVQLPTPAPDYRAAIVGGATDGDRLATDRVGNLFFVPGPARGERELVLVVEADELVFGGTLDGSATIDAAPQVPQTALPETLRGAAKRVAERIGVSRDLPMETALRLLAAYFRSFEPGPPPAGTMGTDYELLALGRVGLCRHRAYAFVVTAQALGIRARMPVSRLHAWVEALVPVPGVNGPRWLWRRIDLGGAYGETDQEVAEVPAHVPDLPDPLPWPRGAKPTPSAGFPGSPQPGTGAGTSPDATDPTAAATLPPGADGGTTIPGTAPTGPYWDGGTTTASTPPGSPPGTPPGTPPGSPPLPPQPTGHLAQPPRAPNAPPGTSPAPETVPSPTPAAPPIAPERIAVLERYPFDATRGDAVEVSGRLPAGVAGPLVQFELVTSDGVPRDVGSLSVTAEGLFSGTLTIPAEIDPGDYVLRGYVAGP